MATLDHRGPDGTGLHLDQARGLAMGLTRLSIIDLDTGAQPIRRHGLTLTVNGEFYDFKRYRALAMADGHRFATKSDSEIALNLHEKHALALVHQHTSRGHSDVVRSLSFSPDGSTLASGGFRAAHRGE